jgi:hypothetical protein
MKQPAAGSARATRLHVRSAPTRARRPALRPPQVGLVLDVVLVSLMAPAAVLGGVSRAAMSSGAAGWPTGGQLGGSWGAGGWL